MTPENKKPWVPADLGVSKVAHTMSWTKTRSLIATTVRDFPDRDVTDLRRQLKFERLEEHICNLVNAAPPLTDEQRARLAALLTPSGGDAQ